MDIAKIRKKARAQEAGKPAETEETGQTGRVEEPVPSTEAVPEQEVREPAPEAPESYEPPAASGPADAAEPPAGDQPAKTETAGNGVDSDDDEGIAELLTFSLGKEEFAFRVPEVEEIIRFQRITVVPSCPEYVSGITSLRGKIIPVIDLRTRLALKQDADGDKDGETDTYVTDSDGMIHGKGKIIILSGPLGLIGAIIDKVLGVVRLPGDYILEPPAHLTEEETRFIEGVVIVDKRFISIIRSADALTIEA